MHHQLLAASTLVLAFTGFSLASEPVSRIGRWLGGARVLGWMHRAAALVVVGMFLHHLVTVAWPVVARAVGTARRATGSLRARLAAGWRAVPLLPTTEDGRDVAHTVRYYLGRERSDHLARRWHYRSKFHYLAVAWGIPAMGLTGLMMAVPVAVPAALSRMLAGVGLGVEPATLVAMAEIAHFHEAQLVVVVSIVWHLYRTLLPPRRDVFTGTLSLAEVRRWHPLWYDELIRAAAPPTGDPIAPQDTPAGSGDDAPRERIS